jgi:hypothetical protein
VKLLSAIHAFKAKVENIVQLFLRASIITIHMFLIIFSAPIYFLKFIMCSLHVVHKINAYRADHISACLHFSTEEPLMSRPILLKFSMGIVLLKVTPNI